MVCFGFGPIGDLKWVEWGSAFGASGGWEADEGVIAGLAAVGVESGFGEEGGEDEGRGDEEGVGDGGGGNGNLGLAGGPIEDQDQGEDEEADGALGGSDDPGGGMATFLAGDDGGDAEEEKERAGDDDGFDLDEHADDDWREGDQVEEQHSAEPFQPTGIWPGGGVDVGGRDGGGVLHGTARQGVRVSFDALGIV